MKAITVCVDYADLLSITLPRNKHHFTDYLVVTSYTDEATLALCAEHNIHCFQTNAFYEQGAMFNKGLAMEQGFDVLGRDGWITVLDADIVLPKMINCENTNGYLFSPHRYMLLDPTLFTDHLDWSTLPERQDFEAAGYCQIFNADDPHLSLPWYGTKWSHAGGCDSEFQMKWPFTKRVRPDFKVLHLGPTDKNWCGRVTGLPNSDIVAQRRANMHNVMQNYRRPELK